MTLDPFNRPCPGFGRRDDGCIVGKLVVGGPGVLREIVGIQVVQQRCKRGALRDPRADVLRSCQVILDVYLESPVFQLVHQPRVPHLVKCLGDIQQGRCCDEPFPQRRCHLLREPGGLDGRGLPPDETELFLRDQRRYLWGFPQSIEDDRLR
ncbi:uncharacterized protein LOC132695743 [Cylas formicarius]|uniref:uncharacterized protein LOC132695743 n=1 Tax=Cylas formicarius TaxID=197179 RepID=UPI00295864C1|nr:uncharacterized protein LOC132695743 [Cylas formicarius]